MMNGRRRLFIPSSATAAAALPVPAVPVLSRKTSSGGMNSWPLTWWSFADTNADDVDDAAEDADLWKSITAGASDFRKLRPTK